MSTPSLRLAAMLAVATLSAPGARAQTPMVASTPDFVMAAAQSDHFELTEARTALAQSHDPRVRAFAQEMIGAHARASQSLQAATAKAGLGAPPPGLSGDQQKLLGALQSQRGADFDRVYLKQQAMAHTEALILERAYAGQGANADVRQAAAAAVPLIQRHLEMAKRLQGELGGA